MPTRPATSWRPSPTTRYGTSGVVCASRIRAERNVSRRHRHQFPLHRLRGPRLGRRRITGCGLRPSRRRCRRRVAAGSRRPRWRLSRDARLTLRARRQRPSRPGCDETRPDSAAPRPQPRLGWPSHRRLQVGRHFALIVTVDSHDWLHTRPRANRAFTRCLTTAAPSFVSPNASIPTTTPPGRCNGCRPGRPRCAVGPRRTRSPKHAGFPKSEHQPAVRTLAPCPTP